MKKIFKDESEVRTFLTNHIFYSKSIGDEYFAFNSGYFGKLMCKRNSFPTSDELKKEYDNLKQPYSIGKKRENYVLIDGSKTINGYDYAFQIDIDVENPEDVDSIGIPLRHTFKLTSEVSHKIIVSAISTGSRC